MVFVIHGTRWSRLALGVGTRRVCSWGAGIGPERAADISASGFPRSVSRSGRATSTASGPPRVRAGVASTFCCPQPLSRRLQLAAWSHLNKLGRLVNGKVLDV